MRVFAVETAALLAAPPPPLETLTVVFQTLRFGALAAPVSPIFVPVIDWI